MQRLNLVLVLILGLACFGFAQKSGGAAGTSTGMSTTAPANTGTTTPGTTTPSTGSSTLTPIAPAEPTTVNPGNPDATTGGSPIVPQSTVPTNDSNTQLQNSSVGGVTTGGGTGAPVTPNFHLETELPPAGVSSTVSGATPGISSSAVGAGQNSGPQTYTVPVLQNVPSPQPNANAAAGSSSIQDTYGMQYAGASFAAQAADNRSLAEIAAQYKRSRATQNARVITNEDIARLNARNDVNVMGTNANTALPQGETAAPPAQAQPQSSPKQKRSPFSPKR